MWRGSYTAIDQVPVRWSKELNWTALLMRVYFLDDVGQISIFFFKFCALISAQNRGKFCIIMDGFVGNARK